MPEFIFRSHVEAPAEEVFAWHSRTGAGEHLKPPWESVQVLERQGSIQNGDRIVVKTKLGPFAKWQHTQHFEPEVPSASYLVDHIQYALPFGFLGNLFGKRFTINKLNRMFTYRHQTTIQDLILQKGGKTMKVLVTGATGLIGSALVSFLTTGGHEVKRLVRSKPEAGQAEILWEPYAESIDRKQLEGADAMVHLSGETIAGRWTEEKKQKIRDSRVQTTRFLSETLAQLEHPPKVLVSMSAVGYYGNRGDQILKEDSKAGAGFLAEVCQQWEAATEPAAKKGIRVVNLRTGVVLSPEGGALEKMLFPFKMGAGGFVGSGEQYWSWIAIDDVIGAIHHAMITNSLKGPVNAVAPNPVTNREFTKVLGRVLSRPTLLPMPSFAARLAFGEMADALLLASARVQPTKLVDSGYEFRHPELEGALRHLLQLV
jgi:uncharacterized protein (TIGR01777 family)